MNKENAMVTGADSQGAVVPVTSRFTPTQMILFENVTAVADSNPSFDWKVDGHNLDFCLIEGTIETTRSFNLKIAHLGHYNVSVEEPIPLERGDALHVSVRVKVWDDDGEVQASGGCSSAEISGKRLWHDMVTRAETRAIKRAIEIKAGLPFINILIKQLFNTYEVSGAPSSDDGPEGTQPRDVTEPPPTEKTPKPSKYSDDAKKVGKRIRAVLKRAVDMKQLTEERGTYWWNKVLASMGDNSIELLKVHETNIIKEIEE